MFSQSSKKPQQETREAYAIEICPNKVSVACIAQSANTNAPFLKMCDFRLHEPCLEISDCPKLAQNIIKLIVKNNLQGKKFNLVLQPAFYRLLFVDAPNVPYNEYKSAMRWQIKDMIDFPIEDAAVDFFLPNDEGDNHKKKVYAVVARISFLQNLVSSLSRDLIEISSVDIHELALRNILSLIDSREPIALLQITAEDIGIIILKNKNICFVRRTPLSIFKDKNSNPINLIVREIQRSLDYYQTELKQILPNKILVAPLIIEHREMAEKALYELGMSAEFLDINNIVISQHMVSNEQQANCYTAIGGALRNLTL